MASSADPSAEPRSIKGDLSWIVDWHFPEGDPRVGNVMGDYVSTAPLWTPGSWGGWGQVG